MEDFPKEDNEDKKTGRKKRRSGDFFMDKVRFLLDQSRPHETEEVKGDETEKKRPFAQKWWKKLFGRVITPPSLITKELITESDEQTIARAPKHDTLLEIPQEKPWINLEAPKTAPENEAVTVDHEPSHEEDELMGELIVSHESEPEPEQELPEMVSEEAAPEVLSLAEFQQVVQQEAAGGQESASVPPEHIGNIVKRLEQRDTAVFKRSETLSRRRDKKLKQEAVKLKQRVKGAEEEQKTLKQEQKAFKRQVAQELQRPVYERLLDKQEQQRRSLQENRGMPSSSVSEALNHQETPRIIQNRSEQLKQFMATNEQDRPETVLHKVEKAAEKDIPIEIAYERRHEVKDEDKLGTTVSLGQSRGFGGRAYTPVPIPPIPASYAEQHPKSAQAPDNLLSSIQASPVYSGAVKNGFWTAVALLAIMAAIYLFR